ncbi:gamma subclass chorismate mutase AroQ [Prosthecobacter sp.]|uniref:gamma subclass chorismate mutase AroQ n=1 Tax=Prosthecobacter sp. TaxID=1965333 RepID=UPI0025E64DAA|nr:gamma subclass chorismate mutase AroQ [Prosthecobacter sp.]
MSWRHAALLGLALILSACSSRRSLPALMVERLNWMDEVALAKQVKSLPITDPVREAELLRTMTQRGAAAGLKPESVRRFFTGQMQAAKVVQEEWLRQHPQGVTSYIKVPDLTQTVRPALDDIGRQMIARLAQPRGPEESSVILNEARRRMTRAGFSEEVMQAALAGLQAGLQED